MDLKQPRTIKEQIVALKEHGIIVDDEKATAEILRKVSYYRLSGYMLQYRLDADSHAIKPGIHFDMIYDIYQFDEELRALLRRYIEKTEVFYKNLIGSVFSLRKCTSSPYNQHYDVNNFYDKRGILNTLLTFSKEKGYFKDSKIVRHHIKKYHDKMPLWVMMELMTYSSVSMFYHAMYHSDKAAVASKIGIGFQTLENHLHCLSVFRNKCAHGARLYNTAFSPPARFNKSFLRNHPEISNDSLFAYILMLIKRLPSDEERKALRDQLNRLMKKYEGKVELTMIGFPSDYKKLLHIKNLTAMSEK